MRVVFQQREFTQEAIRELHQFGQTWLPQRTQYFVGGKLQETVSITSATVNQPGDPHRFTLADLGVEPGSNISAPHVPFTPGKPLIWNGDQVSSWDDWLQDVRSGKRRPGPRMEAMGRGQRMPSPYATEEEAAARRMSDERTEARQSLAVHKGLWQKYVEDFIARCHLDADQIAKAMKFLADAQERAQKIVTRIEPQYTSLSEQLRDARQRKEKDKAESLTQRIDALLVPINKIFETELKPRLEQLPTRAQRQTADTQPAQRSKDSKP